MEIKLENLFDACLALEKAKQEQEQEISAAEVAEKADQVFGGMKSRIVSNLTAGIAKIFEEGKA